MAKQVPFTVHIRVVPSRGDGKRFEYIRNLQKLAVLAYQAIQGISGLQSAMPGGGATLSLGDYYRRGGLGGFANATAAKPQIGAAPAQLMLTGFYESTAPNIQTFPSVQRFSGGKVYQGSTNHSADSTPVATIDSEVKTLKTALDAALAGSLPDGAIFEIFRLDYSGVVYGDKGFHFPR